MCINLSWNTPGQSCQRDAAQDARFMETWGEALRDAEGSEEVVAMEKALAILRTKQLILPPERVFYEPMKTPN